MVVRAVRQIPVTRQSPARNPVTFARCPFLPPVEYAPEGITMDKVVTTVFFDGRFWIALVEKTDAQGRLFVGKYTFGPEPTNSDLLDFVLNKYPFLKFHRSETDGPAESRCRTGSGVEKKSRKASANSGSPGKSLDLYKSLQKENLKQRKQEDRRQRRLDAGEQFILRQEKKKKKKRGH